MFSINNEGSRHHLKKIKPKPLSHKITIAKHENHSHSNSVSTNSIRNSQAMHENGQNNDLKKRTDRSNGEKRDSDNDEDNPLDTNSKKVLNGED